MAQIRRGFFTLGDGCWLPINRDFGSTLLTQGTFDHDKGQKSNTTGRPGYRTMEMIGGSSAPYLARTPCSNFCVPLFCTSFNRVGNKERFRLPGAGGGSFPLYGGTFARSYSVSNKGQKSAISGRRLHWRLSTGFFCFFSSVYVQFSKTSPLKSGESSEKSSGENRVKSCHVCGCHGFFGPDWLFLGEREENKHKFTKTFVQSGPRKSTKSGFFFGIGPDPVSSDFGHFSDIFRGSPNGSLANGGLAWKGANWAKKGLFGTIFALPLWLKGAEELVPIALERSQLAPKRPDFPGPISPRFSLKIRGLSPRLWAPVWIVPNFLAFF